MFSQTGRELVYRTLSPLAARMAHVDPNTLTLGGFGVAILAGLAFAFTDEYPFLFLVAAALTLLFGFIDALDGVVARTNGKTSLFGDFLDHTLDRLSGLVALAGLALADHTNDRLVLLLMLGTLWHGFLGTQIEASFGTRSY